MDRYWENQSGIYDPTAAEVIKEESKRNKEIHDTINEIKSILGERDLSLEQRMVIRDKRNGRVYR